MGLRQCICQICICGRHQCCGHRKEKVPYAKDKDLKQLITESKDRYRPIPPQARPEPIKPSEGADWKGSEPPVKFSTTKEDYVAKPLPKRTQKRQKEYKEPKGKFADCTTYRHDFIPKKGQQRHKIKALDTKDGTMPGGGRFEGETTYKINYTPKPCSKREPILTKEAMLTNLGLPFMGETETRKSYQPPPLQKRQQIVPKKGELKPEGAFEGNTTHKTDYTPKYVVPQKAIKILQKWKPSSGKFQDCTTHRHDYRCLPFEKAIKFVPEPSLQKFEGPFEGISHYRKDYQPHQIGPRQLPSWHPSLQEHERCNAPMHDDTTYRTDYEAPPDDIQTQKSKPLANNLTLPSGPMEKMTTSKRDYRACCPVITKSFKPVVQYKKPEGRFVDCTTTRHDYTPKTCEKSKTSKKQDNLQVEDGLMENLTTTMKDFQWMCIDCPASYLKKYGKDALKPKYTFDKVEAGHQYFKKFKGAKKSLK